MVSTDFLKGVGALAFAVAAAALARAGDFAPRFDELVARATPAQLYALLYDMPERRDLAQPRRRRQQARNGSSARFHPTREQERRETFARVRFAGAADSFFVDPAARYRTIRRKTYDMLAGPAKGEYVPLASMTAQEGVHGLDERAAPRRHGQRQGRVFLPHLAQDRAGKRVPARRHGSSSSRT